MAALVPIIIDKVALGKDWLVMLRTPVLGINQVNDYIPGRGSASFQGTGLTKIWGAFGIAVGSTNASPSFVYNSRGTSTAEDTNPGDLAINSFTSGVAFEVWIIGRGRRSK
jgi:hypothetical protein